MDDIVSKKMFASLLGVSPGRVSQILKSKQLFGDAVVEHEGRAQIRFSVAIRQLRESISEGQLAGANGRMNLNGPWLPDINTLMTDLAGLVAVRFATSENSVLTLMRDRYRYLTSLGAELPPHKDQQGSLFGPQTVRASDGNAPSR
jgi:hypothetical protein